ncbi:NapC/NirT family cytochrome c [Mesobacillus maritimus]|uniref:cytochrome c3 family protein n=1 Tax=Mesobacillus maritimus TaxID=1643336 RepID=UPI00384E3E39
MNDHNEEQRTPPRFSGKWKVASLTLLFLVIFFSISYAGLEGSSSSKYCVSCHEMKPQYYTWEASTHSEVDCVACHVEPGLESQLKSKVGNVEEVYKKYTETYIAPITMPSEIPDESCEKCHNINTRNFTPSGDLIIPHDKHKTEGITCVQCHSGVAHGKISDRRVTYKSDYDKWSETQGKLLMTDTKYTKPQMQTCMDCHRVRNAPLECQACHETTMLPDNHKTKEFKVGGHGKIEPAELQNCEKCHSYMSTESYDLFKESASYTKFLNKDKENPHEDLNNPEVSQYAKTNTFCKDCHGIRPESHKQSLFLMNHGMLSKDNNNCFTCHDNRIVSDAPVTNVACASCHPSMHPGEWKSRHPVPLSDSQKFDRSCLQCHVESTCTKCHSLDGKRNDQ